MSESCRYYRHGGEEAALLSRPCLASGGFSVSLESRPMTKLNRDQVLAEGAGDPGGRVGGPIALHDSPSNRSNDNEAISFGGDGFGVFRGFRGWGVAPSPPFTPRGSFGA